MKTKVLTEEQEQKIVVQYLRLKGYKFTYIPNDTYTKYWSIKMKNKAMGVNAGFPDLAIIINQHLVFIEMKRTKGGVISEYQKSWIEELNKCDDVEARVCKGSGEAIAFIQSFE